MLGQPRYRVRRVSYHNVQHRQPRHRVRREKNRHRVRRGSNFRMRRSQFHHGQIQMRGGRARLCVDVPCSETRPAE